MGQPRFELGSMAPKATRIDLATLLPRTQCAIYLRCRDKKLPNPETNGSFKSFIFSFTFAPLFSMVHKLRFPVKDGSEVSHHGRVRHRKRMRSYLREKGYIKYE
jgi:hypothetical protein